MSLALLLAFCVLGIAFMIYALFQWTYSEKRRPRGRRLPARKNALINQSRRPFLVSSQNPLMDPKDHPEASVRRFLENRGREWKSSVTQTEQDRSQSC